MRRSIWPVISALAVAAVLWMADAAGAQARTFVYHLNAPPDQLDPAKCNNQRCRRVMWPIYEPLVDLSKDSRTLVPALAESWEASPDGLTYTFRLRKGVRFHDGTAFNAAAAKVSLERNYLKSSPFYTAQPPNVREVLLAGLIREIKVQDERTLMVSLRNPKVHILFLIPMVSPGALAKSGAALSDHPVGTGPFKFVRGTSDEIRLAANQDHWAGPPKLKEISFRIVPDSEVTMQDFLAGHIDFLPEVEPIYMERINASTTSKLIRVQTQSTYYLGFRTDRPPLDDVRVRKALTSGVDVERAVLFISRGTAIPAYGPIPPGVEAYDPELKRSQYNAEAARRLLQEAGRKDLRVSLLYNVGWGFFAEFAQVIRTDLGRIGVTVDLVPVASYRELVSDVRQGKADLFLYNWFTILPDAEVWLEPLFKTKSVDNLTHYSSATIDTLLDQARDTRDATARLALYRNAQRLIVSEAPMSFLFHEIRVSAHHTRVAGLELNPQSFPIDRFSRIHFVGE